MLRYSKSVRKPRPVRHVWGNTAKKASDTPSQVSFCCAAAALIMSSRQHAAPFQLQRDASCCCPRPASRLWAAQSNPIDALKPAASQAANLMHNLVAREVPFTLGPVYLTVPFWYLVSANSQASHLEQEFAEGAVHGRSAHHATQGQLF